MRTSLVFCLLFSLSLEAQTASYPSSLVTDYQLKVAINGISTQLAQNIGTTDLTFSVSGCDGIVPSVIITLDSEIMNVTGCVGTTMTVDTRGFDSTTPAVHTQGIVIYAYIDAWHHNSLRVELEAVESALGVNLGNVLTASTGVLSFNTRQGSVTLQSSDVAAVEQDLRTSASPSFASLTLSASLSIGGTLGVTGNSTLGGTLSVASNMSVGGLLSLAGSLTGPHIQNLGMTDDVTFEDVTGRNAIFTGNMAVAGTFSGTHAQNLGTGDSPTFNTVNATAVQSTAMSTSSLIMSGTGISTCIGQFSSTFFILCNGNTTIHNLSAGGTISGAHLQNVGTSDSPSFTAITATAVNGTTITGTNIISTNYQAGFFSGVSCSGTPTSSFVSTNGIVTHC